MQGLDLRLGLIASGLLPFCDQLLRVRKGIRLSFLHFFFQLADEVLADLGLLGVDGGFESVGAAPLQGFDAGLQGFRFRLGGVGGSSQCFCPRRRFLLLLVGPCDELARCFRLGLELGD